METHIKEKVRAGQPYLYRITGLPSEVYEVRFKEQVNHNDLNTALQATIVRYPYFKVRYIEKKGDFYAVPNELPFEVSETDTLPPLGGSETNYYLIYVSHYENHVNVSFHHGLTDGRGIKNFVETLIYYYCRIHYGNTDIIDGIMTGKQTVSEEEYAEPCGEKFDFDRKELKKIDGLSKKGFSLPETKIQTVSHRRYEMKFSQKEFISVCKKYGGSPIILLSMMMSRAIHALYPENHEVINSNFPVDVRNELGVNKTYKNCVKSISLPYGEHEQQMSSEELCAWYKQLLNDQRQPARCRDEFNKIIMLLDVLNLLHSYEKKRKIMKFLDDLKLDTYLISYIGQFNFGTNEKYIDSVHLFSDCSDGLVMNMTCQCGYFTIDFVQDFESESYIKALTAQFEAEGISLETTQKIDFCTPCDHLMRDMPETVEEEDEESTWNKALTAAASVYRSIENGTVGAANSIADAFVQQFLLKSGETVAQARGRLEKEQQERERRQAEQLLRLGVPTSGIPYAVPVSSDIEAAETEIPESEPNYHSGIFNGIANAFVKQFLLKPGETVEEARVRLDREEKEREQHQAERIRELNSLNPQNKKNN